MRARRLPISNLGRGFAFFREDMDNTRDQPVVVDEEFTDSAGIDGLSYMYRLWPLPFWLLSLRHLIKAVMN